MIRVAIWILKPIAGLPGGGKVGVAIKVLQAINVAIEGIIRVMGEDEEK